MLDQFKEKHRRTPERILVTPMALLVLAARKSVAPTWDGVPVEIRHELPRAKCDRPRFLGIDLTASEPPTLEALDVG
jgi:hypothetical protein